MDADDQLRVWRPRVPGVSEVLHAQWRHHAYPPRTHDTWTVLTDLDLVGSGVHGGRSAVDKILKGARLHR